MPQYAEHSQFPSCLPGFHKAPLYSLFSLLSCVLSEWNTAFPSVTEMAKMSETQQLHCRVLHAARSALFRDSISPARQGRWEPGRVCVFHHLQPGLTQVILVLLLQQLHSFSQCSWSGFWSFSWSSLSSPLPLPVIAASETLSLGNWTVLSPRYGFTWLWSM